MSLTAIVIVFCVVVVAAIYILVWSLCFVAGETDRLLDRINRDDGDDDNGLP